MPFPLQPAWLSAPSQPMLQPKQNGVVGHLGVGDAVYFGQTPDPAANNDIIKSFLTPLRQRRGLDLHPYRWILPLFLKKFENNIGQHYAQFMSAQPNSMAFVDNILTATQAIGGKALKHLTINQDTIDAIANTDASQIFMVNHSFPLHDGAMLGALINKLYGAYQTLDKPDCPKPRIIFNRRNLKYINEKMAKMLVHTGLRGIYPKNILRTAKDRQFNQTVLKEIQEKFQQGQAHYFLFPEGAKMWLRYLGFGLKRRFDDGIARFAYNCLSTAPDKPVSMVPVGFYKKFKHYSVFAEKPVVFKKTENKITATQDNKTLGDVILTGNDKAQKKAAVQFIKTVMTSELVAAKTHAKDQIQKKKGH